MLGILLLSTCPVTAQTARDFADLKGQVQSIRLEEAKCSNVSGRLIETSKILLEILSRDEHGNVTGQIVYKRDGSLNRKLGWGHVYDAEGREIETDYYNANGILTSRGLTSYDDKGRKVQATLYNPDGSINHVQAFFYDELGNMVREAHRNRDGTARQTAMRVYDARGQLREEAHYDSHNALTYKSLYAYDDHGQMIEWTVKKPSGLSVRMFKQSLGYDAIGNVIKAVNYNPDDLVQSNETFAYEFDAQGNWIKRTTTRETFKDGTPQTEVEIIYRHITYF